jgi:hypothetical protein
MLNLDSLVYKLPKLFIVFTCELLPSRRRALLPRVICVMASCVASISSS